ncbi:MAG: c-type cytochrome [Gammaproteobacteria bacterium]
MTHRLINQYTQFGGAMGYNKKLMAAVFGIAAAAGMPQAYADPSAAMMANTCAGCHGTNGQSVGPASPNLAGMSETYFIDTMTYFKEGERPATIMDRIAKGYSESQIEAMAKHFAAMPVYKAAQDVDGSAGEPIYEKSCSKCHDEGGALPDDDAGILAGQWLPYLQFSMADFKSGDREAPKKMAKAVSKLSDAELDAVLKYFASQK